MLYEKIKNNLTNNQINILIFLFIVIFAYLGNIGNIIFGDVGVNPGELIQGSTLSSPDNFWYISQIKNYLSGLGFTSNPDDLIQTARRTPGYPIFYGIHYYIFGEFYAHRIITITQCMIFALSAVALGKIVTNLSNSIRIGQIAALFYGTSPYLITFLFMTITEAISPAFVIFSLYFYQKALLANKYRVLYFIITGFAVAVAALIRPTNVILIISYLLTVIFMISKVSDIIKYSLSLILGFLILITPWTLRNYTLTGLWIPLETFRIQIPYDGQGLKINGLNSWYKSWAAHDSLNLHYDMKSDLESIDKYKTIDNFIENEVPAYVYVGYDKIELRKLFIDYQNCIDLDSKRNNGKKLIWGEKINECEIDINNRFIQFESNIKTAHPFLSYIIAPIFYRGSRYIFHSGMHTFKSMQGNKLGVTGFVIKSTAYIINVSLWFLFLIFMISRVDVKIKIFLGSFVVFSFVFIVYNYHVEGRYLLSCYPFLYMASFILYFEIFNKKPQNIIS
jgi:hypothetical protein